MAILIDTCINWFCNAPGLSYTKYEPKVSTQMKNSMIHRKSKPGPSDSDLRSAGAAGAATCRSGSSSMREENELGKGKKKISKRHSSADETKKMLYIAQN